MDTDQALLQNRFVFNVLKGSYMYMYKKRLKTSLPTFNNSSTEYPIRQTWYTLIHCNSCCTGTLCIDIVPMSVKSHSLALRLVAMSDGIPESIISCDLSCTKLGGRQHLLKRSSLSLSHISMC